MLISKPGLSNDKDGPTPAPMMLRGAFILWRGELQRERQFSETKEFDFSPTIIEQLAPRASGNFSFLNRDENARD